MHQVGFSLHDYIEMHGQQNIKCINAVPTEQISLKFCLGDLHKYLSIKSSFVYNRTKITGTLHEDQRKFHCCGRNKTAIKNCCARLNIVI